jgi:hypothetical protein
MDFQAKEWSFLFRNGLIEHIGCKAGAMALSFIQCSHSHKILIFLPYFLHIGKKVRLQYIREASGMSSY